MTEWVIATDWRPSVCSTFGRLTALITFYVGTLATCTFAGQRSLQHPHCGDFSLFSVFLSPSVSLTETMKIVIVGAGISGLATYLQLRKVLPDFETHEVSIYDSHQPQKTVNSCTTASKYLTDSTAVVGNSIGLTPHSVRLLKYIDEDLYRLFKSRGYVSRSYTFRTARGHTLAVLSSGDGGSPEEYTISCSRHQLWRCLYEIVGENNVQHGEVVDVELEPDRAVVRFADGASRIADLVIGADGVRSVVKRVIFGEEDKKCYAPVYE
jgi:2-polyprenyl-6-methoxyphenol hydroxylase-like FAD-dependent oxidoreductase